MRTKRMLNPSTGKADLMTQRVCPVCRGYGAIVNDEGRQCRICDGYGTIWHNKETGLTAARYARRAVFY